MFDVVVGFDIGGTKTSLIVEDVSGTFLHRAEEPTDVVTEAAALGEACLIYRGLARQLTRMLRAALSSLPERRVAAIGVVSAGPIRGGGLWNPPNIVPAGLGDLNRTLPLRVPLVQPLAETFGCRVRLLNDCSGAVLGEVYDGIGQETDDKTALHLVYATMSTGFGVGAWDGGRLVLGKDGNAGELGHLMVHADGALCGCGNRGCVEAYASGTGIVANARRRIHELTAADRAESPLAQAFSHADGTSSNAQAVSPAQVFDAAASGDPVARAVIDDAVFAAGIALAAAANAYDPEAISVGGGIALAHPELIPPIQDEMLGHLNVRPPAVCVTPLGPAVTERGSVAVARSVLQGRFTTP